MDARWGQRYVLEYVKERFVDRKDTAPAWTAAVLSASGYEQDGAEWNARCCGGARARANEGGKEQAEERREERENEITNQRNKRAK